MTLHTFARIAFTPAALGAAVLFSGSALAHDDLAPSGGSGVKGEILMWIQDAEGKLIQLAEDQARKADERTRDAEEQIGRASCRERVSNCV